MSTTPREYNLGMSGILHLEVFSATHVDHARRNKKRRQKTSLPVDRPEVAEMEESNARWDVPFLSTPMGVIYRFEDNEKFGLVSISGKAFRADANMVREARRKFHPNNDPEAPPRRIQQTKKRQEEGKEVTPLSGLRIGVPPAGLEYLKLRFEQAESDALAGVYFGQDGVAITDPKLARIAEELLVHEELAGMISAGVMPELVGATCRVDGDPSTALEFRWLAVHCDSKKIHFDIAFSKISADHMLLGKKKLGRTGPWMTGADLSVRSGYRLKGRELERYRRRLSGLKDRQKKTGRPHDISIEMVASRALFDAMKAHAASSGRGQMWAEAERRYVAWAIDREPAKQEYYRLKEEVTPAKRRAYAKDEAEAARRGAIATRRVELQRDLNRHLATDNVDEDMRDLAKEFPLALIAEAILDGWADSFEVVAMAKAGLKKLLAYLRDLFLGLLPHQGGVGWHQPSRVSVAKKAKSVELVKHTQEVVPAVVEAPAVTPAVIEAELVGEVAAPVVEGAPVRKPKRKPLSLGEAFVALPHLATPLLQRVKARLDSGRKGIRDFTPEEVAQVTRDSDVLRAAWDALPVEQQEAAELAAETAAHAAPAGAAEVTPAPTATAGPEPGVGRKAPADAEIGAIVQDERDQHPDLLPKAKVEAAQAVADRRWDFEVKMERNSATAKIPFEDKTKLVDLLMTGALTWDQVKENPGHFKPTEVLPVLTAGPRERPEPETPTL